MARLLSVNVGLPRDIEWKGRIVHTGIWKNPVHGRCRVGRLNLDGDGQGDLGGHGGEQRAAFVYQIESYRYWQEQLNRTDFVHGQFGENFTIEGLPDDAVCIGDRFQIGSALFEITQPRVTCYRVGIRTNEPRMPALLTSSGRPGFYFRVLREGMVGAGDEIVKVGEANERMTVAEINALLYSPDHARDRLQRALRIEALSPGWRASFEALLQSQTTAGGSGNAGLVPAAAAHPVAPGFQPLAVVAIDRESADVLSVSMRHPDGKPLPHAQPGQYVVLRLRRSGGSPPLLRSYSLSGPLSTDRYRISVKIEPNGAAGTYLREHVRMGDVLDVSSPRGSFVLESGERPVVLLSAGIGATPVLAMLHALAAAGSARPVLWLHAARDGQHHPFAAEVRRLMPALTHGRIYVCYSRPASRDRMGEDFDATGRLSRAVLGEIGIPREADVYLCGPNRFMADMKAAFAAFVAPERLHLEIFNGGESLTPGVVGATARLHIRPGTTPTPVRWCRSRAVASLHTGTRQPTRAFSSWPRRVTSRSAGRAGPVSAITARAVWFLARSPMNLNRSTSPRTATCSFAVRDRFETSSSTCELPRRRIGPKTRRGAMNTAGAAVITFSVEVITLPVSDVDRALRFYVDRVGFTLDVDYAPNDAFRVVQLTPPGSGCSIQIGKGLTDALAGSLRNIYLVVTDLEAARSRLLERGVEVSAIRHKVPIDAWDGGFVPGPDPARRDYASFANFSDPDGNSWVLQERGYRNP